MWANTPESIQTAVDQYIELYQVSKQLEERMKNLKPEILAFMREHEVDEIWDRERSGRVQLSVAERAVQTSRYTTYDIDIVSKLLAPAALQRCVVSVVDKEKLMALAQLGEVDEQILSQKTTKPSYGITVRLNT